MKHARWTCLVGLVAALLLAGCGATPNQTTPDGYGSGYGSDYGGDYGGGTSIGGGSYAGGSGGSTDYGSGVSGGTGYGSGYPGGTGYGSATQVGAVAGGELTVGKVEKKNSGFWLWKRVTAVGQIRNGTQATLSGEVQISFTKKNKVVETQYEFVTDLAPGQTHSFTVKSKKACDDAEVAVKSLPGVQPGGANGIGSSYPSGSVGGYPTGSSGGYPSDSTGGYPTTSPGGY